MDMKCRKKYFVVACVLGLVCALGLVYIVTLNIYTQGNIFRIRFKDSECVQEQFQDSPDSGQNIKVNIIHFYFT